MTRSLVRLVGVVVWVTLASGCGAVLDYSDFDDQAVTGDSSVGGSSGGSGGSGASGGGTAGTGNQGGTAGTGNQGGTAGTGNQGGTGATGNGGSGASGTGGGTGGSCSGDCASQIACCLDQATTTGKLKLVEAVQAAGHCQDTGTSPCKTDCAIYCISPTPDAAVQCLGCLKANNQLIDCNSTDCLSLQACIGVCGP